MVFAPPKYRWVKTLGTYPVISLAEARNKALTFIHGVHSGDNKQVVDLTVTLESLFNEYTKGNRLKPSTQKSYREVIFFYLSDWIKKPVSSVTKEMVESRFYKIRDKGFNGGKPTYSQATKTMRYLSTLMNYAMADDLIQSNPVDILKQKRIDRSILRAR